MSQIDELEHYFDILINPENNYPSEHFLSEDKARFKYYTKLKLDISKFIDNCLKIHLKKEELQFLHDFNILEDEDLDSYLRSVAVDEVINDCRAPILEEISYLFEYDYHNLYDSILETNTKPVINFLSENDERDLISDTEEVVRNYNSLSEDLKVAKMAIIVKDKNMIEILRTVKFGVDRQLKDMNIRKHPKRNNLKRVNAKRDNLSKERDL